MILGIISLLLLVYLIYLYKTREIIIDADNSPYLIRYFIRRIKNIGKYCLHHIVRSDHDRCLHDHPWPFKSLIIWGGYYEIVDERMILESDRSLWRPYKDGQLIRWFGPGSILRRPASWSHRIVLKEGKSAWTFVFMGKKERDWGFWLTPYDF